MKDVKKATLYNTQYKKKVYKRVPFEVKREYYSAILEPAAAEANESVNGYIKKALDTRIGLSEEEIEERIQAYKETHQGDPETGEKK